MRKIQFMLTIAFAIVVLSWGISVILKKAGVIIELTPERLKSCQETWQRLDEYSGDPVGALLRPIVGQMKMIAFVRSFSVEKKRIFFKGGGEYADFFSTPQEKELRWMHHSGPSGCCFTEVVFPEDKEYPRAIRKYASGKR